MPNNHVMFGVCVRVQVCIRAFAPVQKLGSKTNRWFENAAAVAELDSTYVRVILMEVSMILIGGALRNAVGV